MMRKKAIDKPWESIGISRATWYRHGKPTKKAKPRQTVDAAAKAMGDTKRTYQRKMRVLASKLRRYVLAGELSVAQADRLLGNREQLHRFNEFVAELHKPKPMKPPKPVKPMAVERPRVIRRTPSLPTMPWKDDGR